MNHRPDTVMRTYPRRSLWGRKRWWYDCSACGITNGPFDDQDAAISDVGRHAKQQHQPAGVGPTCAGTVDKPDGLRDQIAAALREHGMVHLGDQVPSDEYDCCADAVLNVRDTELQQLREQVARVRGVVADMHGTTGARHWARWLDSVLNATPDPQEPS